MNAELLKGLVLGMALASKQCLQKVSQIDAAAFGLGSDGQSCFASLTSREAVVAWLEANQINVMPEQNPCDAVLDHVCMIGIKRRGIENARLALTKAREA